MKTLTWADFAKYEPCYDPQERYGDFEGTILDILKHPAITDDDKIWAFIREGIVDDRTLRLFACRCVREVWYLLTDERSRNAVEVAERHANGNATDQELTAARASAWVSAAAWIPAANAAAWAASARAVEAARASAWASASAKAAEAEAGAAWASEAAAARTAARTKQVQIAIELLES